MPAAAYRQVPALRIAIAFIDNRCGTYIELTEALDKIDVCGRCASRLVR